MFVQSKGASHQGSHPPPLFQIREGLIQCAHLPLPAKVVPLVLSPPSPSKKRKFQHPHTAKNHSFRIWEKVSLLWARKRNENSSGATQKRVAVQHEKKREQAQQEGKKNKDNGKQWHDTNEQNTERTARMRQQQQQSREETSKGGNQRNEEREDTVQWKQPAANHKQQQKQ